MVVIIALVWFIGMFPAWLIAYRRDDEGFSYSVLKQGVIWPVYVMICVCAGLVFWAER